MSPKASFDKAAPLYDQSFTHTPIGRAQRKRIWNYMDIVMPKQSAHIFELNCGTGEDALHFATMGHKVLATDISSNMLDAAKTKSNAAGITQIDFQKMDLLEPKLLSEEKFDVIFSNFGGLNCMGPNSLTKLLSFLDTHLHPGGSLVFIIMPKSSFVESLYKKSKQKHEEIKKRKNGEALMVNVDGENVKTWFYDPSDIQALDTWSLAAKRPTGFLPSYFNSLQDSRPILFKWVSFLDKIIPKLSIFSKYGDHYLIHFIKNES